MMHDRLIELRHEAMKLSKNASSDIERDMIFADYLLANGVIVPPCKVGDEIYRIGDNGKIYADWQVVFIQVYEDEILYVDDSDNYFCASDLGKTVFLTREEAEAALRKEEGKNV